ncbi:MAG: hypothetical protein COT24_03330 [Candidatus Kerfeldbacteria bacterium CG08_land_8_20_14_0_20_40_16]|uniref:PDZ domain-containing protein n=1 Tax=Candidatus Kerfeldbacteria bacterium CG08_land_8_20_14_0_20_40_16 TaxID=2014244 RepID=A0A2H0YVC3_9BACT|nr:MAG: hypothetical protein COT24_03330 [Candidatus Kerfeldbacteria bacterium CG08_land_8_20_14_0_20_40_16]
MEDYHKARPLIRRSLKIYLNLIVILAVFLTGVLIGAWKVNQITPYQAAEAIINKATSHLSTEKVDFNIFWKAWDIVQNKYVGRPVDERNLFYGAMSGLVASLQDPYSVFFNPDLTQAFNQEISGTFDGIGIEIGIKKNQLVVIAPLPDSPAEKTGILAGDKIMKIDSVDTNTITIDTAVNLIRGKEGTTVNLLIEREGENEPLSFTVTREVIKVQSITWEIIDSNIAYLKISHFNEDTEKNFQKAINEIILKEPKGIILDLRNNPGGYLDVAIDITGSFVEKEKIVVIEDYGDGRRTEYKSDDGGSLSNYPVVVLVNNGSASASEIMAGALQDYGVATIVGEQTFGKGSVQELTEFSDGSSLKLSVAKWLTPTGRSINEEGIKPDVEVKLSEDDYNSDRDPQLEKAIEILTGSSNS